MTQSHYIKLTLEYIKNSAQNFNKDLGRLFTTQIDVFYI